MPSKKKKFNARFPPVSYLTSSDQVELIFNPMWLQVLMIWPFVYTIVVRSGSELLVGWGANPLFGPCDADRNRGFYNVWQFEVCRLIAIFQDSQKEPEPTKIHKCMQDGMAQWRTWSIEKNDCFCILLFRLVVNVWLCRVTRTIFFPIFQARIKKIMQTDEDVGKVAAPVPVIISRALELFIEGLVTKTSETTQARCAKTLSTQHM